MKESKNLQIGPKEELQSLLEQVRKNGKEAMEKSVESLKQYRLSKEEFDQRMKERKDTEESTSGPYDLRSMAYQEEKDSSLI